MKLRYFFDLVEKAYKKLKCSIYFDKTLLPLRNKIVEFEDENIKEKLQEIYNYLIMVDGRQNIEHEILSSIRYYTFPKALKQVQKSNYNNAQLISNTVPEETEIEKLQYFIDMDVRGHILGVLWLLIVGWKLDKDTYEHSYGNRFRKHIIEELEREEPISYSPYLFEPYFQQYESWRDSALQLAQNSLNKNQDVLIFTMDFERFFYTLDMNAEACDKVEELIESDLDEDIEKIRKIEEIENILYERAAKRLNRFIFKIIKTYSEKFQEQFNGRCFLPIGFLPSNVLANWALYNFDKAVVDGWNPLYYGRYVDDIIIVEKVEKNSEMYNKARRGELESEEILKYYLEQCSRWNGIREMQNCTSEYALFLKQKQDKTYILNKKYHIVENSNSSISLQNKKVKIFYFKYGESDAILQCFRNQITHNKSEFRYLPEDEAVFCNDDYNEIYDIDNKESLNKFRGVDGIAINKFALSKFLGKYARISSLVHDKKEFKFARDITKIFDHYVLLDNYTSWEKVLGILAVNGQWDAMERFIDKILSALDKISITSAEKQKNTSKEVQNSLLDYFYSAWTRILSIIWGPRVKLHIKNICSKISISLFDYESVCNSRRKNLSTRMYDKYAVPVLLDVFGDNWTEDINDTEDISFCNINCIIKWIKEYSEESLELEDIIYPYMVTMYDLYIMKLFLDLTGTGNGEAVFEDSLDKINNIYIKVNYKVESVLEPDNIVSRKMENPRGHLIAIGKEKKKELRIAIANARLNHKDFESLVKGDPNRTYKRYAALSGLLNQTIKEKADLLVLPESYIPIEWLATVARTCARNQIGLISGVEHIIIGKKVYNLTAVILPYVERDHHCAALSTHLKNHYAPAEKDEIRGYRLEEVEGKKYELYYWNDCWFPVYCCFELASIEDRALFLSYADLLVAVEWNRDINYYSNIMEALSRDLHCYCVQVNSSDYGDSRITFPAKTEMKDIIKTKGGTNDTILVGTINIDKLRNFQFKGYNLQKMDKTFKPTPPRFAPEIVKLKLQGSLLDLLNCEYTKRKDPPQ